ncbi:phage tail domain-containing protein [Enterococcus faecalis]|uniref:phage tail domain-containing protein n=1 Tax=Enterococcus faecalis TaxID=1351 RepID=UPI003D0CC81B
MDLKIEKDTMSTRMSSLGIMIKDIESTNATIEIEKKSIRSTNRSLFLGANHSEKKITVIGYYYAENELQDELMKDKLNGLFGDTSPYYITKMYSSQSFYDFELPGESKNLDLIRIEKQRQYHYRYKVLLDGTIDYDFQGKSSLGLLTRIKLTFVTVELPFGLTIPRDIKLTDAKTIEYGGTVACSQLEWPWKIEISIQKNLGKSFSITIGERQFIYAGKKQMAPGDKFLLEGTSFTLNDLNINDLTNVEYFILKPTDVGYVSFSTSFKASEAEIRLLNIVELYV